VSASAVGVAHVRASSEETPASILVTRVRGPKVDCLASRVVREDRASLTPIESSTRVKGAFEQPVYSRDRTAVALGGNTGRVIVVDAASLQVRANVRVALPDDGVRVASWPARDRLVVTSYGAGFTRPYERSRVVALDPTRGEVVFSQVFRGAYAQHGGATRSGRVPFLIVSSNELVPPRIVVLEADGTMRSAALGRLRAGQTWKPYRVRFPAFAVDHQGERAFVIDPSGLVAEVGLASLTARYRKVKGLVSKRAGLPDRRRAATWLGAGRLAVSGNDDEEPHFSSPADPNEKEPPSAFTPFGLRVLDTRNWQQRMLDSRPSTFEWLRGRLIAYGRSVNENTTRPDETVVAFDRNGRRVYTIRGNRDTYWVPFDDRLFFMKPHSRLLEVRDARDGRVLGHVAGQALGGLGPC
jgi:hypothetical protein